jgi:hypothetical protein
VDFRGCSLKSGEGGFEARCAAQSISRGKAKAKKNNWWKGVKTMVMNHTFALVLIGWLPFVIIAALNNAPLVMKLPLLIISRALP